MISNKIRDCLAANDEGINSDIIFHAIDMLDLLTLHNYKLLNINAKEALLQSHIGLKLNEQGLNRIISDFIDYDFTSIKLCLTKLYEFQKAYITSLTSLSEFLKIELNKIMFDADMSEYVNYRINYFISLKRDKLHKDVDDTVKIYKAWNALTFAAKQNQYEKARMMSILQDFILVYVNHGDVNTVLNRIWYIQRD